jgi:hypothetical protein
MTISFNRLGNMGHLGNQMFQYASTKGIASKNNTGFYIPETKHFGTSYNTLSNIDDCFDIKCNRGVTSFPQYIDPNFHFDENLFNISGDIDLLGYFQSEKYFKHIEDEIRKDFCFIPEIYDPTMEIFKSIVGNGSAISLHIRRGDYVINPNHPTQTFGYYSKALEYFDSDLPVLILSDDTSWCKEQEIFSDDRFLISESDNCYADLCIMSLCDYHIICNSSFSWWGSWLAKSKKTVAPKNWFGGDCINHNTEDLYLKNWIVTT